MGPWAHGDWGRKGGDKLGPISFRADTSEFYQKKIELPFFRHFLKGDTNYTPAEACVFETGTDQWRRLMPGHRHKPLSESSSFGPTVAWSGRRPIRGRLTTNT
jgi:hypothetical protein